MRRSVISADQLVELLLEACPGAASSWAEHLEFWDGDEAGYYNDVAVFAHHVVESYSRDDHAEVAGFFDLLEALLMKGDSYVEELAMVGLIEDIQNIASWEPHGSAVFERWLQPESAKAWREVEGWWQGVSSLAEMVRLETQAK